MTQRMYEHPPSSLTDDASSDAVYIVPLYCPYYTNKLELNRVEWIGLSELICPSCLEPVKAEIKEDH